MNAEIAERRIMGEYCRATHLLQYITENEVGRPLPGTVVNAWQETLTTMRIADDVLDNTKNKDMRCYLVQESLEYLGSDDAIYRIVGNCELQDAMTDLKKALFIFDPLVRRSYIRSLRRMCEISEKIKSASDVSSLAYLNRLEGQLCSRLFLCLLPPDFRVQDNFGKYLKTFTRLGRFGNTLDTALDMRQDYDNEEIGVQPTLVNRTSLLLASFNDFLHAASSLNPQTSKMLLRKFLQQL